MKRLARSLRHSFTLLCLLLCILSIFLWIRSHRVPSATHPTTWDMQQYLAQPIPADSAAHATLATALHYISWTKGPTFEINWPALEALNLSREMQFSYDYSGKTLGDAIQKILTSLDSRVEFTTDGDVIRISTPGAPRQPIYQERIAQHNGGGVLFQLAQLARSANPVGPQQSEPPLWESIIADSRLTLIADRGSFALWLGPKDPGLPYRRAKNPSTPATPKLVERAGFSIQHIGHPFNILSIALPFWSLTLLTAIPPLTWLLPFFRRHRRRGQNLCPHCGYDLRATPKLCPECGYIPFQIEQRSQQD